MLNAVTRVAVVRDPVSAIGSAEVPSSVTRNVLDVAAPLGASISIATMFHPAP
jgi:hypothetical protein